MENTDKKPLDEVIENMMEEKINNPRDYSFRLIVTNYPKEAHELFNFPGKFADSLGTQVYTDDGRSLQMDCAQKVLPDGEITRKSAINVEHQSYPLNNEKISTIYDYKLFLIHENNIPTHSVVITNIDHGKEEISYRPFDENYSIKFNLIIADELAKTLSVLTNKVKNNDKLSIVEALQFGHIAIFVDDNVGKEVMEKLAYHFSIVKDLSSNLRLDLHQILKQMIKKHFEDDEDKCKELLRMITEPLYKEDWEELSAKEIYEFRIGKKDQIIKENTEFYKGQINKINNELNEKDIIINEKDTVINEKDIVINEKDTVINNQEHQLNEKDHTINTQKHKLNEKDIIINEKNQTIKKLKDELAEFKKGK